MIVKFNRFKINENQTNENSELSGKYAFLTFLQIVSNHDYQFILNDHCTSLYNYHFFFSTQTVKDNSEFINIFKYKHSLPLAYKILLKIKSNKFSFFFGIKDDSILRYGFFDINSQKSYIVGEFLLTKEYFNTISKYKAMSFINKILQNTNIKSLSLLSKIKKDLNILYKNKKYNKIDISDNIITVTLKKDEFSNDEINMNRIYRNLDEFIMKKSWKDSVEYSVDDTMEDIIKIIIIVK